MDRDIGWVWFSQFGFDVDWVSLRRIGGLVVCQTELGWVGLWRSELASIGGR